MYPISNLDAILLRMKSDVSLSDALTKEELLSPVAEELAQVEVELKSYTDSAFPLIGEINQYIHESGGKRLRPAVLLLVSRLCGAGGYEIIKLGTIVELIHVATLVHDDIIDRADLRRGRPSVNARWGNEITVLMGDWMYMTAFQIALELRNFRLLDVLIQLTRTMVTGEMMQLAIGRSVAISVDEQREISMRKTAHLFAACASLPAILSGTTATAEEGLEGYGRALGMAFQLTDDILDYTAEKRGLGKPVLKDLEEGKVTLPIILLFRKANRPERQFLNRLALQGELSHEEKQEILSLIERYQILGEARDAVRAYALEAMDRLSSFPASAARESLMYLPAYILNRVE